VRKKEAFDFLGLAKSADKTNSASRVSASHFLRLPSSSIINLLFLDIFVGAVLREKRHEYNHKSIPASAHTIQPHRPRSTPEGYFYCKRRRKDNVLCIREQ